MDKVWDSFGMERNPFSNATCGSDIPFQSRDFKQALACMKLTVNSMGIGCIFGDTGKGVSYAAYRYTQELQSSSNTVKYVKVFHVSPRDFYKETCRTLGLPLLEKSRQSMITAIRSCAVQLKNQGHPLVLVLDNAQNIPELALCDLPGMISDDFDIAPHMTLLLCGTKDLKHRMYSSCDPFWEQELVSHFTFSGLTKEETAAYIEHRIKTAGGNPELVSDEAKDALYSLARDGCCKDINNILREAFAIACLNKRPVVDLTILTAAAEHRKL